MVKRLAWLAAAAAVIVLALPVLGVAGSWLLLDAASLATLSHQWQTVLPPYAAQSVLLVAAVGLGVALVGGGAALAVTLLDFPGRRLLAWALLLPLAMPAYVLAYAYTDALQFSGPLQTALRAALGRSGALWPDVRSLPGAALLFVLCLYPYVYVLARTALAERAAPLLEAARLLGASPWRALLGVALPLARPAVAAGVALALMETLADYGVGSYFGLSTFTTGIYRAWLVLDDHLAAAQLASGLLAVVALLLWAEARARRRLRFAPARGGAAAQPLRLRGPAALAALALCALPVLLGFVLPVGWLGWLLWDAGRWGDDPVFNPLYLARFAQWAGHSVLLAGLAALAATLLALGLAFAQRRHVAGAGWAARVVGLGYAVPGAVVAVGLLLWVGAVQAHWPALALPTLITGTLAGLLLAYLTRFSAVALQAVQAGYTRLPAALDESARLLGAGPWRVWSRLHAPLLGRSAAAAALLVFVDVMKELPATLMLRPFGSDTLAVVAYQFARDERLAEAALPSLAIVAVGLAPVLLLSRLSHQR